MAKSIVGIAKSRNQVEATVDDLQSAVSSVVLVGLALATVSEAMRKALEKAVAAEQSKEVIIQELNHRIGYNLAMLASILELQLRSQTEPGAKDAFASAAARVHVIANAHDHLLPRHGQSTIDMREYLTACCRNLGDTLGTCGQSQSTWASLKSIFVAKRQSPLGSW